MNCFADCFCSFDKMISTWKPINHNTDFACVPHEWSLKIRRKDFLLIWIINDNNFSYLGYFVFLKIFYKFLVNIKQMLLWFKIQYEKQSFVTKTSSIDFQWPSICNSYNSNTPLMLSHEANHFLHIVVSCDDKTTEIWNIT